MIVFTHEISVPGVLTKRGRVASDDRSEGRAPCHRWRFPGIRNPFK